MMALRKLGREHDGSWGMAKNVPVSPTFLRQVAHRFFFFLPSLSAASPVSRSLSTPVSPAVELLRLDEEVAADNAELPKGPN